MFDKNFLFQWSPDKSSVFGSSAEDGILNIWDHEKVRDPFLSCVSFGCVGGWGGGVKEMKRWDFAERQINVSFPLFFSSKFWQLKEISFEGKS